MELLKGGKDKLKDKVRLLYQGYGQLCATRPLSMITSSVILVVLCSLPLLSHPVFERTATFLFGRIQIGKYQTNVSLSKTLDLDKGDILVQQFNIKMNVTIPGNDRHKYLDSWMIFEKGLEKTGLRDLKAFCSKSLSQSVSDYLKEKANVSVAAPTSNIYRIKYMPLDNEIDTELILLGFTYILVFLYILFSVGKSDVLKSRWGLAFSALMTIIMSLMMALGVCASLDLLPTTLTITEIFPYIVIVIGLENVMIITKSVVSMEPDIDVSVRVAKAGMGKEGWYITKNICAELTILGAGYYTHIPSVQEFCIFAFVGVLSDFFLQMVFFAPILAVDIRRAEICHLQQITTAQQFAVGFNLMQKTALKLVPPSPPKTKWSRFVEVWLKRRMFQKAFMTAVIAYIIYAAYHKVESSQSQPSGHHENPSVVENTGHLSTAPSSADSVQVHSKPNVLSNQEPITHAASKTGRPAAVENYVFDYTDAAEESGETETVSWNFLSKQHWPELLTFYHIRFHEKSLVVMPSTEVALSIQLNETEQTSNLTFTKTSSVEDIFLVFSLAVIFIITIYLIVLICNCTSRIHRKMSLPPDVVLYESDRQLLKGHRSSIEFIVADGYHIVSVCLSGTVRVWDLTTLDCVMDIQPTKRREGRKSSFSNTNLRRRRSFNMGTKEDSSSVYNMDSIWCIDCKYNLIAIGYSSGKVEVYNVTGKKAIGRIEEGEAAVALKLASRNTVLAGRIDGILDIIEVKRGQLDSVEDIESGATVVPLCCPADDGSCFGCHIKHRIRAHLGPIENLIVFAGLVLSSTVDMIKVYEIDDGHCCKTLPSNCGRITVLHQIKERTTLSAAIGYENGSVLLISMTGEKSFECTVHNFPVLGITSNPTYFASFDSDNNVLIWSVDDGQCNCTSVQSTFHVLQLHFLDGISLCIVSERGLFIHDASNGDLLHQIENADAGEDPSQSNFEHIFLIAWKRNVLPRVMGLESEAPQVEKEESFALQTSEIGSVEEQIVSINSQTTIPLSTK
eukprot:gene14625-5708_t